MSKILVFVSFTQADGSISRKYGGTGLGLAISKQLANLLGGDLTFDSEEGKGSIFSLIIPVGININNQDNQDSNKQIIVSDECKEKNEFSGRILVAEDVEANQVLIKALLNRMGLEVTIANDGKEVVDRALSGEYDLIFMDIQMPVMDGYEATNVLREKGVTIPIIALTAHAMSDEYNRCIAKGCDDYLTKPIEKSKIIQVLKKYLNSERKNMDNTYNSVNESNNSSENQYNEQAATGTENNQENQVLINIEQLINILGDEETIKEIIPTYIKDNEKHFEELTEAIQNNDSESIRRHAHAIKGAGRNFGAVCLAEIADKLELAGLANDMYSAQSSYEELKVEFTKLMTFISKPDWIEIAKQQSNTSQVTL